MIWYVFSGCLSLELIWLEIFYWHSWPSDFVVLGLAILLLGISVAIVTRYIWAIKKLKEAGWRIPPWDQVLFPSWIFLIPSWAIIPKEEFQATAEFEAGKSETENLRKCVKGVKAARTRSRK